MWRTETNYDKWSQPGWRIEQTYGNKVLIGNWVEERLQFTRENRTGNSTNRLDYRPQWDYQPDTFVRRTAVRHGEGLPSKLLLGHHSIPNAHFLVSQYDEQFGSKRDATIALAPKLRKWDSNKLAWLPERSDHATKAPPTNYGLTAARSARLHEQQRSSVLPSVSAYRSAYPPPPRSALCHPSHASIRPRPCQYPILLPHLPDQPDTPSVQTTA
ncbi:cilia- and flagella-associated protein 107 [Engraulis encrasicolus]|uniref:cilia- and flagella-associated protein 107 n=1 Tax=Engraulis encrasicolus TaxID=184585 RepID=UPI002FD5943B